MGADSVVGRGAQTSVTFQLGSQDSNKLRELI